MNTHRAKIFRRTSFINSDRVFFITRRLNKIFPMKRNITDYIFLKFRRYFNT